MGGYWCFPGAAILRTGRKRYLISVNNFQSDFEDMEYVVCRELVSVIVKRPYAYHEKGQL